VSSTQDQTDPPPHPFVHLPPHSQHPALRVLVACEFSGIVRDAFLEKGHDAWSCDLLPAEHNSNRHIQGDVRDILNDGWDFLIVAHPPCTRLCNSGVRWLHKAPEGKTVDQMWSDLRDGAELFSDLWNAPIPYLCVEIPSCIRMQRSRYGIMSSFRRASSHGSSGILKPSAPVSG
jgi:hypothetical protein